MDEMILIKKAQAGDMEAFEVLIKPYLKPAYNIALKYLKNASDAQDVSQDAFVKVIKSINSFKGNSSFSTWLYRIVINLCHDFYSARKREDELIDKMTDNSTKSSEDTIFETDKRNVIGEILSNMDENKRKLLILRDVEGFKYEEIAEILDIPIGSVKSGINRARESFKNIVYSSEIYMSALSIRRKDYEG